MATHCSILARKIECSLAGYSPWGRKEWNTSEVTEHACTYMRIQGVLRVRASWWTQVQGEPVCLIAAGSRSSTEVYQASTTRQLCARCFSALVSSDPYRNLVRWWGHGGGQMVASAVKGAWCSDDEVGGDGTVHFWRGEPMWPRKRLLAGNENWADTASSSCPPSFPAAQGLGLLQLRNLRSPPPCWAGVQGSHCSCRASPVFQDLPRCFPKHPPNLPSARAGEASALPWVQMAVGTDEPKFLPLLAAIKHSWRAELRLYCFQQVKE